MQNMLVLTTVGLFFFFNINILSAFILQVFINVRKAFQGVYHDQL